MVKGYSDARSPAARLLLAAAVAIVAAGGALVEGCFPKGQIYGVGNAGGLIFAVNPPEAEVVLDGVAQGRASDFTEERYLKVDGGTHRLEFRLAGFETYARDVYVSNALMRIEATLLREGTTSPVPGGY